MGLENVKRAVTLTGVSKIEDKEVVHFEAHIPSNGISGSISPRIQDIQLYNEHRSEVRQDQLEFQNAVWSIEDEMRATE